MNKTILDSEKQRIIRLQNVVVHREHFFLAGGTGLGVRLGHRRSRRSPPTRRCKGPIRCEPTTVSWRPVSSGSCRIGVIRAAAESRQRSGRRPKGWPHAVVEPLSVFLLSNLNFCSERSAIRILCHPIG
jgi:hypothetical protein